MKLVPINCADIDVRFTAEEKHASRAEKEAEKLKRREEKQMAKDEKRRSKGLSSPKEADAHPPAEEGEVSAAAPGAGDEAEAAPATTVLPPPPAPPITSTEPETAPAHPPLGLSAAEPETTPAPAAQGLSAVEPTATNTTAATQEPKPKTSDESKTTPSSAASPPGSPTKQDKGFRSIFNKFRRRSKAQPGEIKSFAGGHRLSRARKEPEQEEEKKEGDKAPTNNDEVPATASTAPTAPAALATETRASRSPSVSSLSSSDDDAPRVSQEIEDTPRGRPRQPAILKTAPTDPDLSDVSVSRTATNTTNNDFEEAHDRFDDGDLAPPQPSFASKKSESESGSPHRDSKFVEEF